MMSTYRFGIKRVFSSQLLQRQSHYGRSKSSKKASVCSHIHRCSSSSSSGPTNNEPNSKVNLAQYPIPFENVKINPFTLQSDGQDLRRFLDVVGTDPAETKYWYKQFQRNSVDNSTCPFAVIQVEKDVFDSPDMLKSLGSCLSFLQRINLKCVVIHGLSREHGHSYSLNSAKQELASDTMMLVSILESHGTPARPFFSGSGIIEASPVPLHCSDSNIVKVDPEMIQWAIGSGHIPVIQSIGETSSGQLLNLDLNEATSFVVPLLAPRKVILTGLECGIQDEKGEVIPTINVPKDLDWAFHMPWCTPESREKIEYVSLLLSSLSSQSSVVLTSPSTLVTELFTHNGSGTLFKNTEAIKTYKSLEDIDTVRLLEVINMTFGKELKEDYLQCLSKKLNTLYLSEDYNAVAIVTNESCGMSVPYLDKFAVSKAGQGEGLCQLLWDSIRRDSPRLFWRSRHANKISSWYFKKCEGSWTNGEWIVFWYGVTSHRQSNLLTDYALTLDDSFATTVKDFKPGQ